MPATLTQQLAQFVIETPVSAIAEPILARAESAWVDTVGCALAGVDEPVVQLAQKLTTQAGPRAQGTLWGLPGRYHVRDAAFLNAIAAHALDYDDNMPNLRGHPSTTMLPAAWAAAQAAGRRGDEMLAAYVMGVEVGGKLGLALGHGHYGRGFHATATAGIYGATAAAARLFGLDALQLAMAWGFAASQASGLTLNFGTMAKPFHAGHAARCAIDSVLMVQAGMTAHPAVFDGDRGALTTYGGDGAVALSELISQLSTPWEIENPGIFVKLWPCCYCSHRPIAALLQLMADHGLKPDEVQAIEIGFPPGTDGGLIKGLPSTGLAGKFSVEYAAAATVVDGVVNLKTFSDDMLNRDQVQRLMHACRTYTVADDRRWSATVGYNLVTLVTTQGRFECRVDDTPGSPTQPITAAQLDAKFLDGATHALGALRAAPALRTVRGLRSAISCSPAASALQPETGTVDRTP